MRPATLLLLLLWAPLAIADCTSPLKSTYPKTGDSIERWQASHVLLLPSVRKLIESEFCDAAQEMSARKQVSVATLDEAGATAVPKLLDREGGPSPGISMNSSLGIALGTPGFSPPAVKRWGRISFTFISDPDTLQLGSERVPAEKALMLPIGPVTIVGWKAASVVCRGTVTIKAGEEATMRC
jgi:hypothetical protein